MAIRSRGNRFQVDVKIGTIRVREAATSFHEAQVLESEIRTTLLKGEVWSGSQEEKRHGATLQDVFKITLDNVWAGTAGERSAVIAAKSVMNILGEDTLIRLVDTKKIDELVAALKRLGNSDGTINRKLSALGKMMTEALRRNLITKKPHLPRKREGQGRIRILSLEEEKRIVAYFNHISRPDASDLVIVLLYTGFRVSEALRIQARDVGNGVVTTWETKNGQARSVPMTRLVKEILERRAKGKAPTTKLFPEFPTGWAVTRAWAKVRTHFELDDDTQFVPHACRHTFCSRLAQKGIPIQTIQKLAGHKTIQITMRYAHLAPKNLEAVHVLDEVA